MTDYTVQYTPNVYTINLVPAIDAVALDVHKVDPTAHGLTANISAALSAMTNPSGANPPAMLAGANTFTAAQIINTTLPAAVPLVVGSRAYGTSFPAIIVARDITSAVAFTDNPHSFVDESWITFTSAGYAFNSFDARIQINGSVNYAHYNSFQSRPTINIIGTLDSLRSFHSFPTVYWGTTTELNHVQIDDVTKAGGTSTITKQNGIKFAALATGATNHYINFNDAVYIDVVPTNTLKFYVPSGSPIVFDTAAGATAGLNLALNGVNKWAIYSNLEATDDFVIWSQTNSTKAFGSTAAGYVTIASSGKRVAFFGGTPVVQQTGCAVPTEINSCIAAITALRTALNNYGLTTVV